MIRLRRNWDATRLHALVAAARKVLKCPYMYLTQEALMGVWL